MDARQIQTRSAKENYKNSPQTRPPVDNANGFLHVLTAFGRDKSGAIIIMVALMLPILIGLVGLGVETAFWYHSRRSLQAAADAAAIAGAWEIKRGNDETTMDTAGYVEALRNGYTGASTDFVGNYPPVSGSFTTSAAYEVILAEQRELLFASMFMENAVTITVRAVAAVHGEPDDTCILTLEETDSSASWVSGSATATLEGCTLYSNSNASNSIRVTNNAQLTAECVITAGGIVGTIVSEAEEEADEDAGNIVLSDDCEPVEGAARADDPFKTDFESGGDLAIPDTSAMTCLSFGDAVEAYQADNAAKVPGGLYCSDLGNWNGDVEFADGATIFFDGNMTVNSGSHFSGTDITLIAVDHDDDGDYGTLDINGGAVIDISAKNSVYSDTYDEYIGFIYIVDPNAPESSNTDSKFNGGSTMSITGLIYSPSRTIEFTGGNEIASPCLKVVTDTIKFGGNSVFGNSECEFAGVGEMLLSKVIGLVE